MVATQNIDTLGPIWTFSLRGVLTFMARGLDMNGCVFSYFEMTALLHCYIIPVHSLLYIAAKCHFFSIVTWKDIIKYLQKCEGCTHFCEILYLSIYLSVCLSVYPSVCLSIYLHIYVQYILFIYLFMIFFNHNQTKKVWLYYHILNKKWVLQIQLFIVHLKISVKYNANINILFSSFLFLLFFHCFQC